MTLRAPRRFAPAATLLLVGGGLFAPGTSVAADDPAAEPAVAAAPASATPAATSTPEAPPTVAVTKGPFTVVLELSGTFDAKAPAEVEYQPLVYGGELEVVEAAAAGPVEKGQTLVRLKTEKVDEQLKVAETDLAIARVAFQRQSEDATRQEETSAIALAKAEQDARNAEQALRSFTEVEMPLRIQESAARLQVSKDNIQDQTEELAQLEKMYTADELTEETEEIVLTRSRRQLERSTTFLGFQTRRDAQLREVDLPRELEGLKLGLRRAQNDREKVTSTSKPALEQARLELEKARAALARQEEQFRKLTRDREAMTLTAPQAGWATPGSLARGKWSGVDEMTRELRPGGRVKAGQTVFTVVEPGSVTVRTTVPEASLFQVKEGQQAKVTPNAAPETTLDARVARVARVSTGAEYEVLLELAQPEPRAMPGHTVKVKLTTTEKADALTLPQEAVGGSGEKRHVHVWADGKAAKREVKVGATSGGRVEILSGAADGERVLATAPKEK